MRPFRTGHLLALALVATAACEETEDGTDPAVDIEPSGAGMPQGDPTPAPTPAQPQSPADTTPSEDDDMPDGDTPEDDDMPDGDTPEDDTNEGDGTTEGGTTDDDLITYASLAGTYVSPLYGRTHTLNTELWITARSNGEVDSTLTIEAFDDAAQWVAGSSESLAGGYSRYDWVLDDSGTLYYCETAFGEESLEQALEVPSADRDNLETGCGGMFAWTELTPAP